MPTTNINLGFVAAAAGTVNAITATYSPVPAALTDKMLVWFRASGANTSTTPTFSPNGLTARTVVKNGGQALVAGDIPAAGAVVGLVYDLANTRWEIIGYFEQGGWVKVGTNVILKTITDNVGIGTATPTAKLEIVSNVDGVDSLIIQNSTSGYSNLLQIGDNGGSGINRLRVTEGNDTTTLDVLGAYFQVISTDGSASMALTVGDTFCQIISGAHVQPLIYANESTGNVGVGNSSPQEKLHVTGNVRLENETASTIAHFDANKNVKSLALATYPSLTELSYVKGVTSAIQTQLDAKITASSTTTLTNKRITARTGTVASSATPTINTDDVDYFSITALSAAITSFTTNLSGTPTDAQTLWISITDNGTARAIAWGASFEASTIALPTTTVISTRLDVAFIWNPVTSKWRCVGVA